MTAFAVDASVVAKLLFQEDHSDRASALFHDADRDALQVVDPSLLSYEISSVLRKRMLRERLALARALELFAFFERLNILPLAPPGMHIRALTLASTLGVAIFDAHYLAVAELAGCELWVADEHLLRAVQGRMANVRWIGSYPVSGTN